MISNNVSLISNNISLISNNVSLISNNISLISNNVSLISRLAKELKYLNPYWDDERIYQEARKIVIAEIQVRKSKWSHTAGKETNLIVCWGSYPVWKYVHC